MTKIKLAVIKAGIFLLNMVYGVFKLLPVQRKVTMLSRQSNTPSDEFRMVKKGINIRDKGVKVVFLCHTLDGGVNSVLEDKIRHQSINFSQKCWTSRFHVKVGW